MWDPIKKSNRIILIERRNTILFECPFYNVFMVFFIFPYNFRNNQRKVYLGTLKKYIVYMPPNTPHNKKWQFYMYIVVFSSKAFLEETSLSNRKVYEGTFLPPSRHVEKTYIRKTSDQQVLHCFYIIEINLVQHLPFEYIIIPSHNFNFQQSNKKALVLNEGYHFHIWWYNPIAYVSIVDVMVVKLRWNFKRYYYCIIFVM